MVFWKLKLMWLSISRRARNRKITDGKGTEIMQARLNERLRLARVLAVSNTLTQESFQSRSLLASESP